MPLKLKQLIFWNENPRIMDWLDPVSQKDGHITNKQILDYFTSGDGKKKFGIEELARGLKEQSDYESLLVNDKGAGEFIVFEGNRRLAALNLIVSNFIKQDRTPPDHVLNVSCRVYSNLSDEEMFTKVELIHGVGQKQRHSAYCRALTYLRRVRKLRVKDSKLSENEAIELIAEDQFQKTKVKAAAKKGIKTIQKMESHNINKENLYSYFEWYVDLQDSSKNFELCNKDPNNPFDIDKFEKYLIQLFLSKKNNTGATTLRDLFKSAYNSKQGRKHIKNFATDNDFDSLDEWARESGKKSNNFTKLTKIAEDFHKIRPAIDKDIKEKNHSVINLLEKIKAQVEKHLKSK